MENYNEKDYYKILNIPRTASKDEIRKAYIDSIKKYHPDKFMSENDKKKAEEVTRNLNEAYEVLSNEESRKIYDLNFGSYYQSKEDVTCNASYYNTTYPNDTNKKYGYYIFIIIAIMILFTIATLKSGNSNYYRYADSINAKQSYPTKENIYDNQYNNKYTNSYEQSYDNDYNDENSYNDTNQSNTEQEDARESKYSKEDIDFYKQSCYKGNAASCNSLGMLYYNGNGVVQNYTKAAILFKKACAGGSISGCYNIGVLYHNGWGVEQNHAKEAKFLKKACYGGDATACNVLADLYHSGLGVKQDYVKEAKFLKKACYGGNFSGCNNLGVLYYNGWGVAQDYTKAAILFKKACAGGCNDGCINLNSNNVQFSRIYR